MNRIFSLRACFTGAITVLAFVGQARATEARYACSGGAKLTARFSPPSTEAGTVALTFETGETIVLPQVMSADGGALCRQGRRILDQGQERDIDPRWRQRDLFDEVTS